jgi:hypothetical protein
VRDVARLGDLAVLAEPGRTARREEDGRERDEPEEQEGRRQSPRPARAPDRRRWRHCVSRYCDHDPSLAPYLVGHRWWQGVTGSSPRARDRRRLEPLGAARSRRWSAGYAFKAQRINTYRPGDVLDALLLSLGLGRRGQRGRRPEFLFVTRTSSVPSQEMAKIPCENDQSASDNPGGYDVTIVRIGQVHRRYMVLVSADHRRRERLIHQPACSLQAFDRDGSRAGRQVPDPFVVDRIRSARFDKAIDCGLDNDVSEMKGIKDAGVKDRDRGLKRHSAV